MSAGNHGTFPYVHLQAQLATRVLVASSSEITGSFSHLAQGQDICSRLAAQNSSEEAPILAQKKRLSQNA